MSNDVGGSLATIFDDPTAPFSATASGRAAIRALARARTPARAASVLDALFRASRDPNARGLVLGVLMELHVTHSFWDGFADSSRKARRCVNSITDRETRELVNANVNVARAVRLATLGRRSAMKRALATLSRRGGYPAHIAHTQVGLEALRRGDQSGALAALAESVRAAQRPDRVLMLRGMSTQLADGVRAAGLSDHPSLRLFEAAFHQTQVAVNRRRTDPG